MAKLSGPIRSWKLPSAASPLPTHPPGVQLSWVEYAHNSLPNASSGMSPFSSSLGYQPPLFPAQHALTDLLRATTRAQNQANHRRSPAPSYTPFQKVWLLSQDLLLKVESKKLSSCYIGPFEIESINNPCAIHLKLTATLCIHPTFHVSQVKPVSTSPLSPLQLLLHSLAALEWVPPWPSVSGGLGVVWNKQFSTSRSLTHPSSGTSIVIIWTVPDVCQVVPVGRGGAVRASVSA